MHRPRYTPVAYTICSFKTHPHAVRIDPYVQERKPNLRNLRDIIEQIWSELKERSLLEVVALHSVLGVFLGHIQPKGYSTDAYSFPLSWGF